MQMKNHHYMISIYLHGNLKFIVFTRQVLRTNFKTMVDSTFEFSSEQYDKINHIQINLNVSVF